MTAPQVRIFESGGILIYLARAVGAEIARDAALTEEARSILHRQSARTVRDKPDA